MLYNGVEFYQMAKLHGPSDFQVHRTLAVQAWQQCVWKELYLYCDSSNELGNKTITNKLNQV